MDEITLNILTEHDVIKARQSVRKMARDFGFGSADQSRIATAVSELIRNVILYAKQGTCTMSHKMLNNEKCLRVVVEDQGPGIENVETALQDGFSTGNGLGMGLPGIRRLASTFEILSQPGNTCVTITLVRPVSVNSLN
jgi:serine/threonine-protein kinase RsbT